MFKLQTIVKYRDLNDFNRWWIFLHYLVDTFSTCNEKSKEEKKKKRTKHTINYNPIFKAICML